MKAAQSLIPINRRSDSRELATPHVHTRVAILYSEACAGGQRASGQHPIRLHKLLRSREAQCCLVFVVVAFPPPPVTSPATRLKLAPERLCSPLAVPFQRVLPVFIRALKKASRLSLASLSASTRGVNSNYSPPAVALKRCVTAPFASPHIGHDAREHRNRVRVIHLP